MSNVVTTTCQYCIWAEGISGTQTGCKFGRIKKFKERGINVKLNYDLLDVDTDDTGLGTGLKSYYTIERFCNRCRDQEWSNRYDHPYDKCIEQSQVQFDIIVPIVHDVDILDIQRIFGNLLREDAKINNVHLVFSEDVVIKPYLIALNEYFDGVSAVYYTQTRETDKSLLINHALSKCTGMYYLIIDVDNHKELPTLWMDMVENWVNTELYPLIMVKSNVEDGYNGLLVHCRAHNIFGGNSKKSIDEKIEAIVEERNIEHSIMFWEDIDERFT